MEFGLNETGQTKIRFTRLICNDAVNTILTTRNLTACVSCAKRAAWKCLVSNLNVILDGNPVICDCKDYNIISYIRSSVPSSSWLRNVHCAAPPELAKEKVSIYKVYVPRLAYL